MGPLQLLIDGQLFIEMNQTTTALVKAKEEKVEVTFPSLKALYLFHRQFRRLKKQKLYEYEPLTQLINTLEVFYFIDNQLVGHMGKMIKKSFLTSTLGYENLKLDYKALFQAAFKRFF